MSIWDFKTTYRIIGVFLMIIMAASLTYGAVTGDIIGVKDFSFAVVKFFTDEFVDHAREVASSTADSVQQALTNPTIR